MVDFINENKEWLLSGLGITLATLILIIIRWLLLRHRNKQALKITNLGLHGVDV